MRIVHFVADLSPWNGMANTARQFVAEETARGDSSLVTSTLDAVISGVDRLHIHGAWLPVLWRAAACAKAVGAELVIRPAGSYDPVRLAFHGWKKRLAAPFEHAMLRRADILQATCDAEAGWIAAYEPRVAGRIVQTDLRRFFDLSRAVPAPSGVRRILYLGRRHPLKGLDVLEGALGTFGELEKGPSPTGGVSARVRLSGGGILETRMESSVFDDAREAAFAWCDLLVLPTLSENFGRVVAEALERGRPALTTDGAPAWRNQAGVLYVEGFRDAPFADRVRILAAALHGVVRP